MRVLLMSLGVLGLVAACSSASESTDGDAGGGSCSGAMEVQRFDGTRCSPAEVTGICTRSLQQNSGTLETVCAVGPDGGMYLLRTAGDMYLSGSGWAFGPREFGPNGIGLYALEPDTLSAADEARCQSALSACISARDGGVPGGDSGVDGGHAADAATE